MLAITNGRIILPDNEAGGHFMDKTGLTLLIEAGHIKAVVPDSQFGSEVEDCQIYDAQGRFVSPGFINIHIHGCFGADTMDSSEQAVLTMRRGLPSMGVTSFLPTTMTCSAEAIAIALCHIRAQMKQAGGNLGAEVLGAHMEGPFISATHKGAQAEENIRKADFSLLEPFADVVKYITLAPEELEGDYSFVERCREHGIIVSMGHTSASYEQAIEAYEHGVRHATHLYNAMTAFHHRKPGVVGAVLDTDCVTELIADGIHAHAAAQRLVWHAKGGQNIVLITDSLRACGLGDGESELGGQKVFVKGQLATLADGTIAASVATMDHVLRTFACSTGISLPRVAELVSRVPAEEMGCLAERGTLEAGKLADIVIFDEQVKIAAAFVRGELCYQA